MPAPSPRSSKAGLIALVAVVAVLAGREPARSDPVPPRVVPFDPAIAEGRERVGARTGDWTLRSRHAVAVVSRRDGALVDFWPLPPRPASAPALDGRTDIDGLWQLRQVLQVGEGHIDVEITSVAPAGHEIEAVGRARLGRAVVRAVTRYRLDPAAPRLIVTTSYSLDSGGHVVIGPGDALKWGNVDYQIDGVGRGPPTFHGQASWIGRRGASGDLLLRTLTGSPMRIDYQLHHHGIASEIRTRYARTRLVAGQTVVAQRELSYEPLPAGPSAPAAAPSGTLELDVTDERGAPLPFKLSFRGRAPTRDPDFGNDGDTGGAGRFAWSGNGKLSRALAPGRYRLLATAGIERDAQSWDVEIVAGQALRLTGVLPRVIATPGILSADLHLHQSPSVDADVAATARVVAVAAEGVELAVATDHFAVTDLAAAVQSLRDSGRLSAPLATWRGTEVSTVGNEFGHFNVFPLAAGADIPYTDTTPPALFREMRRHAPLGIVQVNHPRLHSLGYFDRFQLDPTTGRVPARYRAEFQTDFDALEVYNGVDSWSQARVRRVIYDWLHLLGQGRRSTATGGSDAHKLFFVDPGLPRNLIHHAPGGSDESDVDAPPHTVVAAIRGGRVQVTSGPILDVDVGGVTPGGTSREGGSVRKLRVRVRAAPWIDVSDVEVLIGGNAQRLRWLTVPSARTVERLDRTLPIPVTRPTFVVVLAMGRRDLPNVHLPGVKPLAISNPIWLEP